MKLKRRRIISDPVEVAEFDAALFSFFDIAEKAHTQHVADAIARMDDQHRRACKRRDARLAGKS